MSHLKHLFQLIQPRRIFILIALGMMFYNGIDLASTIHIHQEKRKHLPFYFSGYRFLGIESFFKGIKYAGYYTDRDLNEEEISAQYAQAQYILAPTILDLDYSQYKYILFDCTSESAAIAKIKKMAAIPLKKNQFGIILAQQTTR